ncbi:MAG: hypothetical protein AMXMBFR53_22210 [Gemmatimonadota bacterium]
MTPPGPHPEHPTMPRRTARPAPSWTFPPGYQLRSRLGSDGPLEAYLARDERDGGLVVLKVLGARHVPGCDADAFVAALDGVRAFDHPGTVPVLQAGAVRGVPYVVTAHVAGVTARDKLEAHGPAPVGQVLGILASVARTLEAGHARGLLHLTLRPHHVLLADDGALLDGIGVAQALSAAGVRPRAAEPGSPATDAARLALLGLELLAGHPVSLLRSSSDPESPEAVLGRRSDVPGGLADLLRACSAEPGDRSMARLAADLTALTSEAAGSSPGPATGPSPERIGAYVVHDVLGKGGMGVVFLAEQVEPLRRLVALKLIKPGMDTEHVLARFAAERQALALMDHPNIAKVLDAGATPTGRPYVAMELVEGPPLTRYCDQRRLTVRDRVRLFLPVCRAIRHAHQKGIIHRDLKPTNVLVAERDGTPHPVVIDFGLAKALDPASAGDTVLTQAGQLLGTLDYMSPEQASAAHDSVDTRSDVYALGAMLYELIAGVLPHGEADREISSDDLRARILTSEPPRPSARVESLGAAAAQVAAHRGTDATSLRRALAPELDWVVLKAMAPAPSERYQAVDGLLADLEAFLRDEPVAARAPSPGYRFRKFLRRHRTGVAVAGAALAALVTALGVTTNLWLRAVRAEQRAASEAETAGQVADFMVDLFQVSDPGVARGNSVTARELLDGAVEHVEADLGGQPAVAARFLRTIGQVYVKLGLYDEAVAVLEDAVVRQRDAGPQATVEIAATEGDLALALLRVGAFDEAGALLRTSVAALEADPGPMAPELVPVLNSLALLELQLGDYESGATRLERVGAIADAIPGYDPVERAKQLNNLGLAYRQAGRPDDARAAWDRSLAIRRQALGPDHPDNAGVLHNLATLEHRAGNLAEAERLALEALGIREKVLGPTHPDVAGVLNTLGSVYTEAGRYDEAVTVLSRSLSIREAALGPAHPSLAGVHLNLGNLRQVLGDGPAAEASFREAERIWGDALGPGHPNVAFALRARSLLAFEEGRHGDAEDLVVRAVRVVEDALDPGHPQVVEALREYADLLRATGREVRADSLEALMEARRVPPAPGGKPPGVAP